MSWGLLELGFLSWRLLPKLPPISSSVFLWSKNILGPSTMVTAPGVVARCCCYGSSSVWGQRPVPMPVRLFLLSILSHLIFASCFPSSNEALSCGSVWVICLELFEKRCFPKSFTSVQACFFTPRELHLHAARREPKPHLSHVWLCQGERSPAVCHRW